jgi:major membrane immunogen (membrane-anchored lipoprotein)
MKARGHVLVAMSLVALAGCGKSSEAAFNKGYDDKFRSSCVASASKSGMPTQLATTLCECAITEINKKYSASQKLTLSEEQSEPILKACLNKTVQR